MNPASAKEAKQLFGEIKKSAKNSDCLVAVAPPSVYLYELGKMVTSSNFLLAAQDVHFDEKGAHTGEISPKMLQDAKASMVIIGHSERRAAGETDELVQKKLQAALKAKLTPILCVGEKKRDSQGDFFSLIEAQIKAAFKGVVTAASKRVIVAYEPIWAIGTGKNATVDDVEEMRLFINKVLSTLYDRPTAEKISVLYGGSVNAENCAQLFNDTNVNGFLVGGASLRPADFRTIIQTLNQ